MGPDSSGQRGYALLLLLTVMGLFVLLFVARSADTLAPRPSVSRMSPATADALRQAREALIGYAATYSDDPDHSYKNFGYLLLPDLGTNRNGNLAAINDEGRAAVGFSGNRRYQSAIGRFPWRTLGLPPLKDEYGECLWYVVSGSHQYMQKTDPADELPMNWDTVSYLDMTTPDGLTSLSGGNPHNRAVAVIFSAGPPIPGQNRSRSAVDLVDQCGGNYDVINYLDPTGDTPTTNHLFNWFTGVGVVNHSTDPSAVMPPTAVKQLLASPLPNAADRRTLNDRAIYITSDDIFKVVRRRISDTTSLIADAGTYVAACKLDANNDNPGDYPNPAGYTSGGGVRKGRLPASGSTCAHTAFSTRLSNWQDNFFYYLCNGAGACLQGNDLNGSYSCHAAVVFAGSRGAKVGGGIQSRSSNIERADVRNYLEGENYMTYLGPPSSSNKLDGSRTYTVPADGSPPSTDIVVCLP